MPIESEVSTNQVRKLPPLLTSLCNRENLLNELCEDTFQNLSITTDEAVYLEESTRMQSQSLLCTELVALLHQRFMQLDFI